MNETDVPGVEVRSSRHRGRPMHVRLPRGVRVERRPRRAESAHDKKDARPEAYLRDYVPPKLLEGQARRVPRIGARNQAGPQPQSVDGSDRHDHTEQRDLRREKLSVRSFDQGWQASYKKPRIDDASDENGCDREDPEGREALRCGSRETGPTRQGRASRSTEDVEKRDQRA